MQENKPGAVIIEGHVQGLSNTRSLGEADIPVYVVDKTNCIARYSKYCHKYFHCPDFHTDDFADFLIELARNENIQDWILIPSNDHAVYTISKHRERLQKFYKVITPHLDIINKIYDKSKLFDIAENLNIPIPVTQYIKYTQENINGNLNFPVITKGRYGLSFFKAIGKKVLISNNQKELRINLKIIEDKIGIDKSITQEVIPYNGNNHTVSYTAFCEDGKVKTYWMGEKLREHPLPYGTATYARSINIEECHRYSIPLLRAINYTGVCEVEYLFDPRDKQYKLIEINARTWLWVDLARKSGVNFPLIIYNYLNNNEFEYPTTYLEDIKWYHLWTELFYNTLEVLRGNYNLKDIIKSYRGEKYEAVYSKGDVLPFVVETILLPYLYLTR